MNTPTHLILGAAAFGKPGVPVVTTCALAGAFAPDISLYAMAGWHLLVLDTPPNVVFDQLYFSDRWQAIFAVDNSFILWGLLFTLSIYLKRQALTAFSGAGFLHLIFDFPLHNDDARQHFWPLTDWVYHSPFSYWDRAHHGDIIAPIEMVFSLVLLVILWRKFEGAKTRAAIAIATLFQLAPVIIRWFVFRS
jgi:hypothetical protein